jgi:hypothetical protein
MRIEKKIWPEYFELISNGSKKFELRLADWECNPGDILLLKEWDPKTKEYTGKVLEKTVGYVLKTKNVNLFPSEDVEKFGYQIISLE